MPKVIRQIAPLIPVINSIKFHQIPDNEFGHSISDDVSDDVAQAFLALPGFVLEKQTESLEDRKARLAAEKAAAAIPENSGEGVAPAAAPVPVPDAGGTDGAASDDSGAEAGSDGTVAAKAAAAAKRAAAKKNAKK